RPPRPPSRAPPEPAPSAPASAAPAASARSCQNAARALLVHLAGVEGLLDECDEVLLARGLLLVRLDAVLADGELEREPAAGHLIERFGEQPCVLRFLGQLP